MDGEQQFNQSESDAVFLMEMGDGLSVGPSPDPWDYSTFFSFPFEEVANSFNWAMRVASTKWVAY